MKYKVNLLTLICCCSVFATSGQHKTMPLPKSKNNFIVIAHRGSHLVKPENSIAAIQEAIELGVDYVEMDLRTTRDGHLVLIHNEMVDRTTSGKGRIQDLNLDEVKRLTLIAKDGHIHKLPLFEDALRICKNRVNVYLDFKDADAVQAYREIRAAGMEAQVLVYINTAEQYKSWRRAAPKMPLMSGLPKYIRTEVELASYLAEMPLAATDNLPYQSLLFAMRENGLSVFLDVQASEEDLVSWNTAINKGVQGVQTDHPEALIKYLKQNNLRRRVKVPIH